MDVPAQQRHADDGTPALWCILCGETQPLRSSCVVCGLAPYESLAGIDPSTDGDLEDEAEDPVRRRVLRPEVELHLVKPEERRPRQGWELRDRAGRRLAHESTFRFVSFGPGPPPSG